MWRGSRCAPRGSGNADIARLRAKACAVVDRASRFVLPLMDHLVKEGMQSLVPAVASQMAPTDRDLAGRSVLSGGIVTEAALHAARHANRNGFQLAAKVFVVEARMPRRESLSEWLVFGACSLAAHRTTGRVDNVRDDPPLCGASFGARSAFHKRNDRLMDLHRRREVALVDSKHVAAEADHDVSVPRQLTVRDSPQSQRPEQYEQVVRVARGRRVKFQRELSRVGPTREERLQRAKHFTGPATKLRCSADQSIVDTSMSASVILMLLTDDGRPPLDRLLIVPDVEMIVPRFVCSM